VVIIKTTELRAFAKSLNPLVVKRGDFFDFSNLEKSRMKDILP
jgi:hypothetical protein